MYQIESDGLSADVLVSVEQVSDFMVRVDATFALKSRPTCSAQPLLSW